MHFKEKAMYVVDKLNLKIIEVPENYYECSVCHEWLPESEFMDEGAKGHSCSAEWYNGCRPHCIYVSDTIEEAVADYNMQIQEAIDLREQQIRNYLNVMEKVVDQLRARKV